MLRHRVCRSFAPSPMTRWKPLSPFHKSGSVRSRSLRSSSEICRQRIRTSETPFQLDLPAADIGIVPTAFDGKPKRFLM